jgi:dethiobiotin synthetase
MGAEHQTMFVTATDTGVGKTVVTAALVALYRSRRRDAVPMKPVQTGCSTDGSGKRSSPDLDFALAFNNLQFDETERDLMCPFRFTMPASPHLSAAREDTAVSLDVLLQCHAQLAARHDVVIVEGAGGVLSPLNRSECMADLIEALRAPTIIVARPTLGTLNHTRLTLHEIQRRALVIAGIVISKSEPGDLTILERDNLEMIEQMSDGLPVVYLPFIPNLHLPECITSGQRAHMVKTLAPLDRIPGCRTITGSGDARSSGPEQVLG